jgi:hypothetical protein
MSRDDPAANRAAKQLRVLQDRTIGQRRWVVTRRVEPAAH